MLTWNNTRLTNIQITTHIYDMVNVEEKKVARYMKRGQGPLIQNNAILVANKELDSLPNMEIIT